MPAEEPRYRKILRIKNDPDKQWERHWRRLEVFGLWFAAMVGVFAIIVSSIDSHDQRAAMDAQRAAIDAQQTIMRGQLLAMESQQRPWMVPSLIATEPLAIAERDPIAFSVNVKVKNVGQAVATGIDIETVIVAASEVDSDAIHKAQSTLCDHLREEEFRTPDQFGFMLFPEEEYLAPQFFDLSAADVKKAILDNARISRAANNSSGQIQLVIVGCIDYQFYVTKMHHQTRFAYSIGIGFGREQYVSPILDVGKSIPAKSLRFTKTLWGNGYAD